MLTDEAMPPPPVSFVEKPVEDDFVLPPLPPPPSEEDLVSFTTQSSNSSKTDSPPPQTSIMSPTFKATAKYSVWMPASNSRNTNGTAAETGRKLSSTSGPTGFRSVLRPVSKKSEKGPIASTVTTNYSIPSQGLPQASENMRVTPDNELPEGAVYETQTLDGNVLHTDTYYPTPGEKTVLERTKKTTIIKAEHHGGMGPTDEQGVPVALRSTVDNPKQWYKNMFKQIHKYDREDEENGSNRTTSYDAQEERPVVSQAPMYKPKKLGRITDYTPSSPYVVENKPQNNSVPQTSTSYKPARTDHNKKPEVSPAQEPVHGTEYHEKDYTMADYVVTEPKHVVQIHPTKPKEAKGPSMRKMAKAKFEFLAQNDKQIPLKKDQIVVITKEINKDWYEGETTDGKRSGIFPVAYVQVIAGQSEHKQAKKGLAKVKFDFNSTNSKLLSVKKGDSVDLLEKVDKNWYKGSYGQKVGLIPANYLEVIREPEQPKTMTPQPTTASKPTSSVNKAPDFSQYFHTTSVSSSSSNSEPDDKVKMSKASFLANAVVNSGVNLSKPKVTRGEFDIPELDDATMGILPHETNGNQHADDDSVNTTISSNLASNLHVSRPGYSTSSDATKDFEEEFPITQERYICTFGYNPQNEDELELIPGDVIQVVEKCDDGWYVGTCERTGGFGTFPGNYVEPAR